MRPTIEDLAGAGRALLDTMETPRTRKASTAWDAFSDLIRRYERAGAPSTATGSDTPAPPETPASGLPLPDSGEMARRLRVAGWAFKRHPLGWVVTYPGGLAFGSQFATLDAAVRAAWDEDGFLSAIVRAVPGDTAAAVNGAMACVQRSQAAEG